MKIRIERNVVVEAALWVAKNLPKNPSMPILAGVLITAKNNSVEFSSFDYETSGRITGPAQVAEEGSVLVSGRLLSEISSHLPDHDVELIAEDSKMMLRCGTVEYTLQTLPVADYPQLPNIPQATGTINSEIFANAVSQVIVASGKDGFLPVFTGILVEIEGDTLSLLSTDRYRMAVKELPWNPTTTNVSGTALVPARVLGDAAKSMTDGENLTISLSSLSGEGIIGLSGESEIGHREITTRLIDGEFPPVRYLMDVQPTVTVKANIAEIRDAVRRVAVVAERNTPIKMTIQEDAIVLEAATGDQAQAHEVLEAVVTDHTGNGLAMTAAGFNPMYLRDALSALNTTYVSFAFSAPGKPCLMLGLDDLDGEPNLDYRHVIMLMRLTA